MERQGIGKLSTASRTPVVVAHRGLHAWAPENSIAAVRAAIAAGVRYIEVDVRASRDGELFVLHDATLQRTTNLWGKLSELSRTQARRARLRDGSPLPLLEEVLPLAAPATVCLDVKDGRTLGRLIDMLRGHAGDVQVWSRDATVVRACSRAGLPSALISSGLMPRGIGAFLWEAREVGASAVSFFPADIEPHVAAACRNAGMPFFSGTPNDAYTWKDLAAAGVHGLITDRPVEAQRWLDTAWLSPSAPIGA